MEFHLTTCVQGYYEIQTWGSYSADAWSEGRRKLRAGDPYAVAVISDGNVGNIPRLM